MAKYTSKFRLAKAASLRFYMSQNQATSTSTDEITIDRARINSITLYDVTEDELSIIERGSPSSNYLNFSIALLSIGISGLVSILTTKIENIVTLIVFVCATIICLIIGVFLLVLWRKFSKGSDDIFLKIRSRKNPQAIRDQVDTNDNSADADSQATS